MISLCRTCEASGICTTYGEPDLICDDAETDQCNSSFCGCIESPTLEPTEDESCPDSCLMTDQACTFFFCLNCKICIPSQPSSSPNLIPPTDEPSSSPTLIPTDEPTSTYCSVWCPGQFEWDANPRQDNNVYACAFWICKGCKQCLPNISTISPSNIPTSLPTSTPTVDPTRIPSSRPTNIPTIDPTHTPSFSPTMGPSMLHSVCPSQKPSRVPSLTPTFIPTEQPSLVPTHDPTSLAPTVGVPTDEPSPGQCNDGCPYHFHWSEVCEYFKYHEYVHCNACTECLDPLVCEPWCDYQVIDDRCSFAKCSECPECSPTSSPTVNPTIVPTKLPPTLPTLDPSVPTVPPTMVPTKLPTA